MPSSDSAFAGRVSERREVKRQMSNRVKVVGALVLMVGLAAWSAAAFAGVTTGSDGGDTATVGAGSWSSWPGTPGAVAPVVRAGGSGPSCTYVPVELAASAGFDLKPGGPTPGEWYLVQCAGAGETAQWVATGPSAQPAVVGVAVNPGAVAARAEESIVLPAPSLTINPASFSVVNLSTWLAVNPSIWHRYEATATADGVSATAVATPQMVTWNMGDGDVVVCDGPGTAYDPDLPAELQSTTCSYTYTRSSEGEPSSDGNPNDGAFPVTAVVTWTVTWTAVGAPGGGVLPALHTQSTEAVRVEQVESIGVAS
jgi:hypothetical protein